MLARVISRGQPSAHAPRRRVAGAVAVALVTPAIGILAASTPALASPTPNYQPGSDTATFTVTGVLDRNCLVSTGGSKVYIKPGDAITFNSSLAGVNVGGLSVGSGSVAGLNVSATIDAGKSSHRSFTVAGGKSVKVSGLSAGKHTLQWNATGIPVAAGLLGGGLVTLPLNSDELKSGAKLSWSGTIYVNKGAARCSVAVLTPEGSVSLGPVHVSVPSAGINLPGVSLPKSVPSVPNLAPTKSGKAKTDKPKSSNPAKSGTNKQASSGLSAVVPGLTVPQQVVPGSGSGGGISGGGGGYRGNLPNSTSQLAGSTGDGTTAIAPDGSTIQLAPVPGSSSGADSQTVDLASANPDAGSGQMPVLLAILAIITLALVAGTYARMFLLRRTT